MLSQYFEVVVVSSSMTELETIEKREGVRTIGVPMQRHISIWKDVRSLFKMIRVFYQEKPYIVHSMTPKAGLISMLAAWITRVPVRMHTYTGLVFPTATGFMQRVLIWMDRLLCACATYINPEGQGVKNDLIKYRITTKPLHIIANGNVRGVDLAYYCRNAEVMERAQSIRDDCYFTFCFVGRVVGDKGINELIRAFGKLQKQYSNIRLLLVGRFEPDLDPLMEETLEEISQNPNIISVGEQSDVRPYYAASDAFVFPSYREGFPNTVLEAGAMGLPSIVTDINGCNEIIMEGENGTIIPVRDSEALYNAMSEFIRNKENLKEMGMNARSNVERRFAQEMIWEALLETYVALSK